MAAGPDGLTCTGTAGVWAFGLGFELHAEARKTTTAATGHHVRVVMLGAPLKDFRTCANPNLQAGGPEEVTPVRSHTFLRESIKNSKPRSLTNCWGKKNNIHLRPRSTLTPTRSTITAKIVISGANSLERRCGALPRGREQPE